MNVSTLKTALSAAVQFTPITGAQRRLVNACAVALAACVKVDLDNQAADKKASKNGK